MEPMQYTTVGQQQGLTRGPESMGCIGSASLSLGAHHVSHTSQEGPKMSSISRSWKGAWEKC